MEKKGLEKMEVYNLAMLLGEEVWNLAIKKRQKAKA